MARTMARFWREWMTAHMMTKMKSMKMMPPISPMIVRMLAPVIRIGFRMVRV